MELISTVTPEDIASAMDEAPANLYFMLHELAVQHQGIDEDVDAEERNDFLNTFLPPMEHLLLDGNIAAGHRVNRLLQEMTKVLSSALLAAEKERRRHAS